MSNEDISSLIHDYSILNKFIQSNRFEKTLELYSILSNISFNKQNYKHISLKILIKDICQQSPTSYLLYNDYQELMDIFQNTHFILLIDVYDLVNKKIKV